MLVFLSGCYLGCLRLIRSVEPPVRGPLVPALVSRGGDNLSIGYRTGQLKGWSQDFANPLPSEPRPSLHRRAAPLDDPLPRRQIGTRLDIVAIPAGQTRGVQLLTPTGGSSGPWIYSREKEGSARDTGQRTGQSMPWIGHCVQSHGPNVPVKIIRQSVRTFCPMDCATGRLAIILRRPVSQWPGGAAGGSGRRGGSRSTTPQKKSFWTNSG